MNNNNNTCVIVKLGHTIESSRVEQRKKPGNRQIDINGFVGEGVRKTQPREKKDIKKWKSR